MNMDFATIMVIAVVVTGAIWGLDAALWAPKRRANLLRYLESVGESTEPAAVKRLLSDPGYMAERVQASQGRLSEDGVRAMVRMSTAVEYAQSFFPVILVVLVLRSFLVEPFRIPSGSMMPTLLDGDFILVNKYTYGIRLPVINRKIIEIDVPKRGDVVVFRYPRNPSVDYIKRIVGLPGDTISYYNKQLYVNGKPMPQESRGTYIGTGTAANMTGAERRLEHLDGVDHEILLVPDRDSLEGEVVVPPGHYFVMGDNRDNSNDSRVWGFVPDQNLVGRAFMIWMNWDSAQNRVSWERIGNGIR